SPFLNLLDDDRIQDMLQLMGRQASDALTPAVAREVCVRTGSRALLTGSIARLGTHYVLGLRAQDCHSSVELANDQIEAASREDVLPALDAMTARVRRTLGESLSSLEKHDAPLSQVSTRSLDALQAYTQGWDAFKTNGDAAALVLYKRAVELDPEFALAH